LRGHEAAVNSVAFSPNGKQIVSGSSDRTVRLWDATTGQSIGQPLRGHEDEVISVAFSPDSKQIVSGSNDATVRLWDAATGQPVGQPLRGHEAAVYSVAFSPDGKQIVSGSKDKNLRLWPVTWATSWKSLLQTACEQLDYHSMLLQPTMDVAKEAKRTCERYVYSTTTYKLEKGDELAKTGNINQAIRLYQEAEKQVDISSKRWNHLCWFGSLHRQAESVLFACDKAISAEPSNAWFYNSRGIARALAGDRQGAIADFSMFLNSPSIRPEQKSQQQQWITELRAGQNPFTDTVLNSLLLL
jgi:WD40 repeat protein